MFKSKISFFLPVFFASIYMATISVSYGQAIRPPLNVSSPEVSSLGIYGQIPVSLYTGVPNVSVPIYEIKVGQMKIPISANYHISSVKPNIPEGCLGLGWSLQVGGYITRNVRGVYDEKCFLNGYSPGFYAHSSKLNKNINFTDFTAHMRNLIGDEYYELTADEFSFSFNGYTGNFYYNENKGWTVVSEQPIKVLFDEKDGFINLSQLRSEINPRSWGMSSQNNRFFNKFTLVTPDGCKYVFGGVNATEYSISYYHRNTSDLIATSWFLSEIITPEGRVVKYNYKSSGPQCDIRYAPQSKTAYNLQCASGAYNLSTGRAALTGFLIFPVLLSSIESPNEVIDFDYSDILQNVNRYSKTFLAWKTPGLYSRFNIYSANEVFDEPAYQFQLFLKVRTDTEYNLRLDIANSLKWEKLDTIRITPKYVYGGAKNVCFDYIYSNRRKIAKITEIAGGKLAINSNSTSQNIVREYRFKYDAITMPTRYIEAGEDSWGYFNGDTISTASIPDFSFQSPRLRATRAETLIEIQYPTKGKVRFEYEQNSYAKIVSLSLNALHDELGVGGGLRISKIVTLDSSDKILNIRKFFYSNEKGRSSNGVLRTKPLHAWNYYSEEEGAYITLNSKNGFFMPIANMNSPIVSYPTVFQEDIDSIGQSQGYVKFMFSDYDQDMWGESHYDESYIYSTNLRPSFLDQYSSRSMERGKLLQEEYFDAKNNLIKTVTSVPLKMGRY